MLGSPSFALVVLVLLIVIALIAGFGFYFTLKLLDYDLSFPALNTTSNKIKETHKNDDAVLPPTEKTEIVVSLDGRKHLAVFCFLIYIPLIYFNNYLLRIIFTPDNMFFVNRTIDSLALVLPFLEICFAFVVGHRLLRRRPAPGGR